MEKDFLNHHHQKELQLLPPLHPTTSTATWLTRPTRRRHYEGAVEPAHHQPPPSLDLKLSISLQPVTAAEAEALKWQAAEQIRLAAIERAYADRVREMTRREIEMAQSEFARARAMWDVARDEVARVERVRDGAAAGSCMGEITCHSCRQRFRPSTRNN